MGNHSWTVTNQEAATDRITGVSALCVLIVLIAFVTIQLKCEIPKQLYNLIITSLLITADSIFFSSWFLSARNLISNISLEIIKPQRLRLTVRKYGFRFYVSWS